MAQKSIGIIMNGATGRMGYRQHLVRSILAIREQGGVELSGGDRVQVEPILVGQRGVEVGGVVGDAVAGGQLGELLGGGGGVHGGDSRCGRRLGQRKSVTRR